MAAIGGRSNPLAVPIVVLIALPLYSNAAGTIPGAPGQQRSMATRALLDLRLGKPADARKTLQALSIDIGAPAGLRARASALGHKSKREEGEVEQPRVINLFDRARKPAAARRKSTCFSLGRRIWCRRNCMCRAGLGSCRKHYRLRRVRQYGG